MESGEWFPAAPGSAKGQQITFIAMSTVDDLSYSPSEGQKNRDAAQIAATGRRSWKTLKGKPEAVWPPALEGALIEALEEYRKIETRPTTSKHGVRYPMRNRFISDYIFEKTGKLRTAKQVGSRLQQLRDTCKDPKLYQLLGKVPAPECKTEASPTPSLSARELSSSPSLSDDKVVVYVQIELPGERHFGSGYPVPRLQFTPNDMNTPISLYLSPIHQHSSISSSGRHSPALAFFSNAIELFSPWPLVQETSWSVYKESNLIHRHTSVLRIESPSSHITTSGGQVYSCHLVPDFWQSLCEREDPNHITVVQVLRSYITSRDSNSLASAITMAPSSTAKEVSIVYHFNVPTDHGSKFRPTTATELHRPVPIHPSSSHLPRSHDSPHSSSPYPESSMGNQHSGYWPPHSGSYTLQSNRSLEYAASTSGLHWQTGFSQSPSVSGYSAHRSRMQDDFAGVPGYAGPRYEMNGDGGHAASLYAEPRTAAWGLNLGHSNDFARRETMMAYSLSGSSCY
ncbi:hypothetical protein CC1G_11160 [Coprinopsis cinerea okayama7|uniref:TEA domain-containing protein n=1 Tax=Coprinopsis cinerea (strain Okayama-7 / 130 / ATCC MYA-4618 / FGSC 9003) TaxID=240176 RepID=A8P4B7_COPC7|nr:hypothetical protein CC1G_11160 [Coprinopsis cinerea okayama7\|eukprot:XP_001838717.1 hypothetical protein CC1G_11160 [Coprinopsis cinerea okayama7\